MVDLVAREELAFRMLRKPDGNDFCSGVIDPKHTHLPVADVFSQRLNIDVASMCDAVHHQTVDVKSSRTIVCVEEPELKVGGRHALLPKGTHIRLCGGKVSSLPFGVEVQVVLVIVAFLRKTVGTRILHSGFCLLVHESAVMKKVLNGGNEIQFVRVQM